VQKYCFFFVLANFIPFLLKYFQKNTAKHLT